MLNVHIGWNVVADDNSPEARFAEALLCRKWQEITLDSTLAAVEEGVDAMVQYAAHFADARDDETREEALGDLECAAFATARWVRKCLSFNPDHLVELPFDLGYVLSSAVGDFFFYMPDAASQAICTGAELAERVSGDIWPSYALTDLERGYVEWATPRLICRILYNPYGDYEEPEDAS